MSDKKNKGTVKQDSSSMGMIINTGDRRSVFNKGDSFLPGSRKNKNEITQMFATPPKPGTDGNKGKG